MMRIQLVLLALVICVSNAAAQPAPQPAPEPPRPATPTDAPEPRPSSAPPEPSPYAQPAPYTQPAPVAEPTPVAQPAYYPPAAPPEEAAAPPAEPKAGPFAQGNRSASILFGFGSTLSSDYFILGAGLGFFLLDGLELEVGAEVWMFGDPTITKLTPGLRYVLHMVPVVKPYIGGFYRYTFIEDRDNASSIGARFGVYLVKSQRFMLGLGGVGEYYLDSDYDDTVWYPEVTISIAL